METQRKPKRRSRKKAAVLLLVLLILFSAAAYLGYTYLRAENIHVEGNKEKTEEYILNLSGVKPGTHLFNINSNTVAKNLEQDPFLRLESIDVTLPDKVTIKVTERERGAVVLFQGNFIVLDKDSNILEIKSEMSEEAAYPMISGLNVTAFDLGRAAARRRPV